jgi:hypothetical protein
VDPTSIVVAAVSLIGVLAVGILAPAWLLSRTERIHREDRQADWDRQDQVAEKAEKAAADLAKSQKRIADKAEEAATLLLANNERVAQTQAETNGKLDVIHTLVNSNMTAAMQSEFDAVSRELAMMREVAALKQAAGQEPSAETTAAIGATEAKLHELDAALADRAQAQARVTDPGIDVTTTTTIRGAGGEA